MLEIPKRRILLTAVILLLANFYLWQQVLIADASVVESAVYFLNVGQGDSQLVLLDSIKILIDGGENNGRLADELEKVLSETDNYFDLVIASHANIDHYGGFLDIADYYKMGAFIHNGKESPNKSFAELKRLAKQSGAKEIILRAGDRIKYGDYYFLILSPSTEEIGQLDENEASLVMLLKTGNKDVLFTGDIGKTMEEKLADKYGLKADVLKVSHHGSRYSSARQLVFEVSPKISIIGVGKNSYGHPSAEVVKLLAAAGSVVYRTDKDGTVRVPLLEEDEELPPPVPPPPPPSYKISFIKISQGSENSVTDEFIKIHNGGVKPVNLEKWSLKKQTTSGNEYSLVSRRGFEGEILAGGNFLVAHRDYQGKETPDLYYSNKSNSLASKNNTVILYDNFGNLVAKKKY